MYKVVTKARDEHLRHSPGLNQTFKFAIFSAAYQKFSRLKKRQELKVTLFKKDGTIFETSL